MRTLTAYLFGVLAVLAMSCAQVSVPSGGPEDRENPFVYDTACIPNNFSTNVMPRTIMLKFNEYIKLRDIRNQVIISPPFDETPEFRLKGKKLFIDIEGELRPNTTYTINFGDAVEDITEGNKAINLKYVFSTGDMIDSLEYRGRVRNAFTGAPEEGAMVMLYRDMDDSIPMLQKPDYFARTNKDGYFRIDYIKEGEYKQFVLQDGNRSYTFDLPDEPIAFMEEPVHLPMDSGAARPQFMLFIEDHEKQYLESSYFKPPGPLMLVFNRPLTDFKYGFNLVADEISDPIEHTEIGVHKDTAWFWFNRLNVDSLVVTVEDDTLFADTLIFDATQEPVEQKFGFNSNASLQFNKNNRLVITFSQPISSYVYDSLIIWQDSVQVPYTFDWTGRKMSFLVNWEGGKDYQMTVPPGTIKLLHSEQTDTMFLKWSVRKLDFYGQMTLNLELPETDQYYLVDLMQGNKQVQRDTLTESSSIAYEQLVPGKYSLRVIYDANKNGKWDTGNYLEKLQPEQIYYYEGQLEIRSKWSKEEKWILK